MNLSGDEIKVFQSKMLTWYFENGRDFPWRRSNDPYKILVAEILLQKTNVRKVVEVYESILEKCPTIFDLGAVSLIELISIIRPIGLSYRAERLIKIADIIIKQFNGIIPNNYEELIKLKGIGNYIANAILIFAFNQKRVLVDTNVIFVIEHELGIRSKKNRARTDRILISFIQLLAPESNIKEFNWALLDYGTFLKGKYIDKIHI